MKNHFVSKIWMNVEIFSFIVIFYVAGLVSPQILPKKTLMGACVNGSWKIFKPLALPSFHKQFNSFDW